MQTVGMKDKALSFLKGLGALLFTLSLAGLAAAYFFSSREEASGKATRITPELIAYQSQLQRISAVKRDAEGMNTAGVRISVSGKGVTTLIFTPSQEVKKSEEALKQKRENERVTVQNQLLIESYQGHLPEYSPEETNSVAEFQEEMRKMDDGVTHDGAAL